MRPVLLIALLFFLQGDRAAAGPLDEFAADFATPTLAARPLIRWWFPAAKISDDEIKREISEMKAAGFGGAEVSFLPSGPGSDLARYGWDTQGWSTAIGRILTAGARRNFRIDLTLGPAWPLSTPRVSSLEDPRVEQELVEAHVNVQPGSWFNGRVPQSASAKTPGTLVAVVASQLAEAPGEKKPIRLMPSSIDLTAAVHHGRIEWRAPGTKTWILFAFWQRPSGQKVTRPVSAKTAYVIDHFSPDATDASIRDWDEKILSPEIKKLLRENTGDFFGDSLELVAHQLWTPTLLKEFRKRRGYDLNPFLPVLHIENLHDAYAGVVGPSRDIDNPPDFETDDGPRVRRDYYRTLSELMQVNHLGRLRKWARALGRRLRYQPAYGTTLNLIANAAVTDVPESESLYSGNQADEHRAMASAAHVLGKPVVSLECCANLAGDYGQTIANAALQVRRAFASGVNQLVLHGFPHRERRETSPWPGWQPFSPAPPIGFSEAWDSRQPFWPMMRAWLDSLARTQFVLRAGRPVVDLAIYREKFWWPANRYFFEPSAPAFFDGDSVRAAGFSYEFVDSTLLRSRAMRPVDGRLAPEGPGYHALILDRLAEISVRDAQTVLEFARLNTPIFVIGDFPERATDPADNAALREVRTLIKKQASLRLLSSAAELPQSLQDAGVAPTIGVQNSPLMFASRRLSGLNLYYLFNPGPAIFDGAVSFAGRRLDRLIPETGAVGAVNATTDGGRTSTHLHLDAGENAIFAASEQIGVSPLEKIAAWTTTPTKTVGPTVATLSRAPVTTELRSWTLEAQTFNPEGLGTKSTVLDGLKDWREIDSLADDSGRGIYRAHFNAQAHRSALLRLGRVEGAYAASVNGRSIGAVDPFQLTHEISEFIHVGDNVIEIAVATTLRNRLATLWQKGWAEQLARFLQQIGAPTPPEPYYATQAYGLIGPVTIEFRSNESSL